MVKYHLSFSINKNAAFRFLSRNVVISFFKYFIRNADHKLKIILIRSTYFAHNAEWH